MPTRFDHAVIGVRDLDAALLAYQRLGFDARMGGRHGNGGTHNGLIRFGLDYIELIAVYDERLARTNTWGESVLDALHGQEAALIGYALATESIDADAEHFHGTGPDRAVPRPMQRQRPDGQMLSWRLLIPGTSSWNRPWPFLIQWDMSDAQRLLIDLPGEHLNGARGWTHIDVAVHDLASATEIYTHQLALTPLTSDHPLPQTATFALNQSTITLLSPHSNESIKHILTERGEGPCALGLRVVDLAATSVFFTTQDIKYTSTESTLTLDPQETLGIQLFFVSHKG